MPDPAVIKGVLRHLRRTERRRHYDLLGDSELLARFLADRDETAFEELVCRHGPMVRAVCRRVLGPTADADDAFQAAFLVLLRKARSIRRTDLLANWLCAVAYRTARQALRRRYRLGSRERNGDELPEPTGPDDPPRDWLPLFDAALQRLPSKYRDPVVLCELQGLPRPEAAKQLGLNEGTLSSRLGRARDLLRRKLSPYGFPLSVGSALAPAVVPEALTASTAAAAVSVSAASVSAVVLTEGVLTAMFASKLKTGSACAAVLLVGAVAGMQFTGPVKGAGGPPGKDGPPATEVANEPIKPAAAKSDPKPGHLPAEYEPFQGEWVATLVEWDGDTHAPRALGVAVTWTFTENRLATDAEAKGDAAEQFRLDPKAKPAAIDFTLTEFVSDGTGRLDRIPCHGVYKFEPDGRLVICYRPNFNNNQRPVRFATAKHSGATVVTLTRPKRDSVQRVESEVRPTASDVALPIPVAKEESKPTATDVDLGKVVGAWELTDVDGQSAEAAAAKLASKAQAGSGDRPKQRWEALRRLQLLPAAGPMDLVNQPGANSFIAYVDLDEARRPKWFTLHATEESRASQPDHAVVYGRHTIRLCGIYKLDGEKLVVCLPEAEGSPYLRPTDFRGDGEGGLYLLTYRRAAKNWKPDGQPDPKPPATVDPPLGPMGPPPVVPDVGPQTGPPPGSPVSVAPGVPVGLPVGAPLPVPDVAAPPTASIPVPDPLPQKAEVAPASDLDRLQGMWIVTQVDGKPVDPDPKRPEVMEFLKDRVLGSDGAHGRVRLDESKSPRQITISMSKADDPPRTGIYKLESDRLTIASCGKSAKLIPTGFEPDAEAGITVMVLERPKPSGRNSDAGPAVSIPNASKAIAPPARDLQKEIDQLREQLKRLEKELKDRKPEEPPGSGARGK